MPTIVKTKLQFSGFDVNAVPEAKGTARSVKLTKSLSRLKLVTTAD
jgi:hypothetical protein